MTPQREEEEESGSSDSDSQHDAPLEKQVFVKAGLPICFHIDKSVTRQFQRDNLTADIEKYGGRVLDHTEGVDTVIVNLSRNHHETLQDAYNCHRRASQRDIWVEPMTFIQICIKRGSMKHRSKPKQGMGGTIGGIRMIFTPKDEKNLCRYIAIKIPQKAAGGRTGERLYRNLPNLLSVMPEEYDWVRRHPWSSWREHYKKNADRLDPFIRHYVKRYRPTEKQTYDLDRRLVKKRFRHETLESDSGLSGEEDAITGPTGRGVSGTDSGIHYRHRPNKRRRLASEIDSSSFAFERAAEMQPKQRSAKGKGRDLDIHVEQKNWQHNSFFDEDTVAEAGPSQQRFATFPRKLDTSPSHPDSLFSEDEMNQPGPSDQHPPSPDKTMGNPLLQNTGPGNVHMPTSSTRVVLSSRSEISYSHPPPFQPARTAADPRFLTRRGSTSSMDSFPIYWTRASVAKKRMEEEDKHTPYKPPSGTRAALIR